jgi:hypothetical protein
MPNKITRIVTFVEEYVTKAQAQHLVVEAKIHNRKEIDAYEYCAGQPGMLSRVYTIPVPNAWSGDMSDITEKEILDYARRNMPDDVTFGRS